MSRTCVFLDGGYLQKVLEKDFERPKVDFGRIGPALANRYEPLLRTYYYNCLPYQAPDPTEADRERFRKAEKFFYRLRQLPNFEIRLGRLEFRGVDRTTNTPIFEQKRVDVQLAVDLLTLAFSRQISTAIVVAGDSDFIPAFQAAKDQGVRLVLASGRKNPAHRDLLNSADQRMCLDEAFIREVRLQ